MDRRVRRTRNRLVEAMVHCAGNGDWDAVSIQQICDAADVARSTFYLHFQNKAELLDYAFASLGEEMRNTPASRSLDADGVLGVLPVLFSFMVEKDHGFLFSRRRPSVATLLIGWRLKAVITEMIAEEIAESDRFRATPLPVIDFIAAGVFAAIDSWYQRNEKPSVNGVIAGLDGMILRLLVPANG